MPNSKNNLEKKSVDAKVSREILKRKKLIEEKQNAEKSLALEAMQNEIIDQENNRIMEEKALERLPGESDENYYKRRQAENIKRGRWSGTKKKVKEKAENTEKTFKRFVNTKLKDSKSLQGDKERAENIRKLKARMDKEYKAVRDKRDAIRKKLNAAKRIQNKLNAANAAKEEIKRKIKQAVARIALRIAAWIAGILAGAASYIGLAILLIILIVAILKLAESLCRTNPFFDIICSWIGF